MPSGTKRPIQDERKQSLAYPSDRRETPRTHELSFFHFHTKEERHLLIVKSPKQRKTLVIGHQNPDTDSVVSALVYAQLRNQIEGEDLYEGVTLGPLNAQTKWLLQQGHSKAPRHVKSIDLKVRDLANSKTPSIEIQDPLGKALTHIARDGVSTIPVLSKDGKLVGILSDRVPDCNYFHQFNTEEFLGVLFTLSDLVSTFDLEPWHEGSRACAGKLTLDPETIGTGDILLSGISKNALTVASDAGAAAVIVCTPAPRQDWDDALQKNPALGVYRFTGSLMALTSQLSHCIPAENAMTSRYAFLHPEQPINDVRSQILATTYPLPVTDNDGYFIGLISRTELLEGRKPKIILVDHFEAQQAVKGIADAEIIEILDHHRVGNLETQLPISVDCRPLGSTATIIAQRFKEYGISPTPNQAILLLGAIISDTLALTSPTTTEVDRNIAKKLASTASLDLGLFSMQVLVQADTTLTSSAETLVSQDLKEFGINRIRFSVSQIETVDRNKISEERITELGQALQTIRKERALNLSCLLITDVLQKNSMVLIDDADQRRQTLLTGGPDKEAQIWEGCVSRKKQFLPKLLERLSDLTG